MKTLAVLQNPAAKLSDVDPAVAQHYHDKLLEARREKAHVRRTACKNHRATQLEVTRELSDVRALSGWEKSCFHPGFKCLNGTAE